MARRFQRVSVRRYKKTKYPANVKWGIARFLKNRKTSLAIGRLVEEGLTFKING